MAVDHLNTDLLEALPDEGPVTMLNLMRFRGPSLDGNGSGWDAYPDWTAKPLREAIGNRSSNGH
jgi:hypothetical protein